MPEKFQLFIDIGNTRIKSGERIGEVWSEIKNWSPEDLDGLKDIALKAERIIISAVSEANYNRLTSMLNRRYDTLNYEMLEKYISYNTPETLGIDRVLAAIGAWRLTGSATVVIDAGTATTIDEVSVDGVFTGGVIMPGMQILEDGLSRQTDLPQVDRMIPGAWPPRSTRDALRWGITGSYIAAVQAHLNRFKQHNPDLAVVITGGDGHWLYDLLDIRARVIPELVFHGMDYVADQLL